MTALLILLAAVFLGTGTVSFQNCLRGLFLPIAAATFVKFKQNAFEICACRNVSYYHENMNFGDNTPFSE